MFHFASNLLVFCTKVHGGAWDFIGWFLQRAVYYTITTSFYGKETGYNPAIHVRKLNVNWSAGTRFRNLLEDAVFNLVATRKAARLVVKALL